MSTFTVNGKTVAAEKNQKLIRFLRDELRLTSVKDGCSEGACGTCTVLVDGKAVRACIFTTDKMEGKSVLTVEGLSDFEKAAYTYGFGEAGAVQCGFCIPGMVMAAKGLLDSSPDPTVEEIRFALRTNICRCTGYVKIIEGVRLTAKILREGRIPDEEEGRSWKLGSRVHRIDVAEKVQGTGIYPDDVYMEGMICASAVRSAHPRALVKAIHTEKAKALPGVVGVFTAADIPGQNKVGHLVKDWDTMIAVGSITHYLGTPSASLPPRPRISWRRPRSWWRWSTRYWSPSAPPRRPCCRRRPWSIRAAISWPTSTSSVATPHSPSPRAST